jgi:hypothetical protein
MTPTGTSSLRHFLINFQAKIFAPSCVAVFLIHLIMMPLVPLAVPYFFFISSSNAFSLDLLSRINTGSIPRVANPMICAIISTLTGTSFSSHMSPPCVTANNCLMHAVAYWPLPKCGSFNKPKIPILSNPASHWCGWLIVSPSWFTVMVYINTLCEISRNLVSFDTSWLKYLSFPT